MTSFTLVLPERPHATRLPAGKPPSGGGGWYLRPQGPSTGPGYHCPAYGREPDRFLVDRRRGGADAGRPGPDGRGQRPGVPPPGPPLRGRPRLLGDGLLRRNRAPERADARLP